MIRKIFEFLGGQEPYLKESYPQIVTIYVRSKINIPLENVDDILKISMLLSNCSVTHYNVELPNFPFITERQFKFLPEYFQDYFEPMKFTVYRDYSK